MSDYVIETRGLTKTYGEQNSVSNLSIHVRKGRIYGLLEAATVPENHHHADAAGSYRSIFRRCENFSAKPLRGNEKGILPRIGSSD